MRQIITLTLLMILFSCKSQNPPLNVVQQLDIKKYTGTWYEIARLPNSFEKGLECITANYTLLENGKIQVVNKGHLAENLAKVKTAKGKAYIPDKNEPAKLRVTFFWPFYGDYWVLALDSEYQYALVGVPDRKYLWVLSRTVDMDDTIYQELLSVAKKNGFAVDKMVKVKHTCIK